MLNDLRYAFRMMVRNPGLTAAIILTLALSIGANSTLFSLVNRVLFSPLPFKEPEGIVWLESYVTRNGSTSAVSGPDFLDWKARTHTVQDLCVAQRNCRFILTGEGAPASLKGWRVSPSFIQLFGISLIGSGLPSSRERNADSKVVVLTHRLWQDRFGADPGLIGRKLTLNGDSYVVVGVMPKTLGFIEEMTEVITPLLDDELKGERGRRYLSAFGRLCPGVTLEQARAELSGIAGQLEKEYPDANTGFTVRVNQLQTVLVGSVRTAFLVLHGVVGFVLLIACVNIASLLLARSVTRNREMAVRVALGAGRWRLLRQLLTESVLLSFIGGGLGVLLSYWGINLLKAMTPQIGGFSVPFFQEISIDGRVLAFTAGVSLLAGLAFGLVPAWQASNPNLQQALKESERGASAGHRHHLLGWLTVAEVALSLVVLAGAGLMVRSYDRVRRADPGFDPRNVLCVETELPFYRYGNRASSVAFYEQVLKRVAALPGVESVGLNNLLPLIMENCGNGFQIEGRPPARPGEWMVAEYRLINANYFRTMKVPLKQGRFFSDRASGESTPVVIINEKLARQFFGQEKPLGRRIKFFGETAFEIVGVVGDEKVMNLTDAWPVIYQPFHQDCWNRMSLAVRVRTDPRVFAAAVQKEILAVDADQPVSHVTTMEAAVAGAISITRFVLVIFCVFAGVALALATLGVYGVMAYSVSQRTREIGIRMALGASARAVLLMILRQGFARAVLGLAIGLVLAIATARVLRGLLYDTSAADPLAFAAVVGLLAAVALVACYLPARRAMRIEPNNALRCE